MYEFLRFDYIGIDMYNDIVTINELYTRYHKVTIKTANLVTYIFTINLVCINEFLVYII